MRSASPMHGDHGLVDIGEVGVTDTGEVKSV